MPLFCFLLELCRRNEGRRALCLLSQRRRNARSCEAFDRQNALSIPHRSTFPNSLNEIGRESGNVARSTRGAHASSLCDAQNLYDRKRLVPIAHLVRCVDLDAAMQNRGPQTGSQFGFDF
jgi:hypothetical protein